jgi:guanine nucleotide-binding protein G(i) subunit alpha
MTMSISKTEFDISFIPNAIKFAGPNFVPDKEGSNYLTIDLLNMRFVTKSITETILDVKGQRMHFFDVSGLKNDRKFWVKYFDHVNCILFLTSLVGYDQTMSEEPHLNRMVDSINVFHELLSTKELLQPQIVLFLNKKDLFVKQIRDSPIQAHFPEFTGSNPFI